MQKILTHILIGTVFLLTVLPLIVFNGLFFPFITSKAFLFRILVETGLISLFVLALADKRYIPRITPITIFFGLFVIVMLVADLLGSNVIRSIWSNFERMEGWITLVHLFGAFLLFERVLSVSDLWKRWIQISLGVSVLVGIHGVMQLAGLASIHQGTVRLDANFGNATYLAVYTLFHVFFAGWLLFTSKSIQLRVLYGAIGVLNIAMLYFTSTRGALLGLVFGVGMSLLVYAVLSRSKKILAVFLGISIAAVLSFGVLVAYKDTSFVASNGTLVRIADISLEAGETRFAIWGIAREGFMEHPILGWGQGNFNLIFSKYYKPFLYDQEPWFDRAHNVYFDWLVAGGLLGLGSYLLLFGSLVYFLFRGRFSIIEKSIGIGLLTGYAINNIFVFDNLLSYLFFVFIAAWISSRVVREYKIPRITLPKDVARSLIVIAGLFVMYIVNVPALNANGALLRALSPQYAISERQVFFKEALSYNSFGSQEIREQMVQFALSAVRQADVPVETKIALLVDAAIEIEKQAAYMPESARVHLLYGLMLRLLGNNELAYEVLSHARDVAPHKQSVLIEFAFAAEFSGRAEEALSVFKTAYELDTSYDRVRVLYEEAENRLGG
ncbi:O-antigen ligase family protein [Candidatus Wolfebacteria bacterium]|nr:O-antigen ligase family protein [Candidatus Wolfebacteria bacterium]MBL1434559.1 O-antigen ligase family protein [Candidatus Wolfebacteria bacterium]